MAKCSILLIIVLAAIAVSQDEPTFAEAKVKFGVQFVNFAEDAYREQIYNINLRSIRDNNANPNSTYKAGVNPFTFWPQAEFVAKLLRAIPPEGIRLLVSTPTVGWNITTPIDWTTVANVVTPVRDQGQCGACWAFSAVAALESFRFQAYGTINASYSEQQLVDCSNKYGNQGCNGGWMNSAFNYVKANGITTKRAYPYTSRTTNRAGSCKIIGGSFRISGYKDVTKTCDAVAAALSYRPLSVAVDATNWSPYKSGIFSSCGNAVNHAVLLVGVTNTTWRIKNSWNTWWGESGYMRLNATAGNNACAICSYASYPNK